MNLFEMLKGNPDTTGTWMEITSINPAGIEISNGYLGTISTQHLIPGNQYQFEYTVQSSLASKPPSTSIVTLNIQAKVFSGIPISTPIIIRSYETINLDSYLIGATPGGLWTYIAGPLPLKIRYEDTLNTQNIINYGTTLNSNSEFKRVSDVFEDERAESAFCDFKYSVINPCITPTINNTTITLEIVVN